MIYKWSGLRGREGLLDVLELRRVLDDRVAERHQAKAQLPVLVQGGIQTCAFAESTAQIPDRRTAEMKAVHISKIQLFDSESPALDVACSIVGCTSRFSTGEPHRESTARS